MPKKILITGGAGFIGHHLVYKFLSETDYDVVTLDRLDTSGTLNRLGDVLDKNPEFRPRLTAVYHDMKAPINEMVARRIGKPNFIVHTAAGSHVDRSIAYPMEFVMDNVVGTCSILDFARTEGRENLEKFLYFSTDEVFGPAAEGVFHKEWDHYKSGNPYSATKAGGEELCMAFHNTYKLPVLIQHTMNVYGVRQHWEKFIPLVIRRALLGEEVMIHANPSCTKAGTRHYISSEDVGNAVMFLLDQGEPGDKYNVVGEREVDNLTLAQMIAGIVGKPLNYKMVDFHSSRPGHDLRYALDGTKMAEMGWTPSKGLEQRLEETVKWSLDNPYWIGL